MTTVYIIDDDEQIAELLKNAVLSFGLAAESYTSAQPFFDMTLDENDIILLDLNMPDMDGVEVIRTLAINHCPSNLILISGHDAGVLHSAEKLAQAHSLKISASLTKPIRLGYLREVITGLVSLQPSSPVEELRGESTTNVKDLRRGIQAKEFILHYQPQIDLVSGRLSGVEALVRWQHPERGMLYPDMFVEVAEQNQLIGELTQLVLDMALKQCSEWKSRGLELEMSVNISSENVKGLYLPEKLMDALDKNDLDPGWLTLEVTESALMGELVTSLDILTRLRMKGFHLSIDDFGTGYSSLSQLHKIPFTELKIDKSFVMSMTSDVESRAIAKTCIMLGHELNMKVVAEGVESEEILKMLRSLGCDVAQGYHISRPIPAEELFKWAQQHNH